MNNRREEAERVAREIVEKFKKYIPDETPDCLSVRILVECEIEKALKTLAEEKDKERDCEMVLKDGELNGNAFKIQSLEEENKALRESNKQLKKDSWFYYMLKEEEYDKQRNEESH
jgi:O-phosphoseryl-tRNA(Cys) synthetase